jgi:hypothetical protein
LATPIPVYEQIDYTKIVTSLIWATSFFSVFVVFVNYYFKMNTIKPEKNANKGTIRVLAGGFTAAWIAMQTAYARNTLDTVWLGMHIELFVPVNILLFLGMIGLNIVVGGTYITNWLKGKDNAGSSNQQISDNNN